MRKQATVVAADEWLNGLIHQSPAFQAQVEGALAAVSVAQDVVALRESRGLSQAQLADRLGITQSAIAQLESAQPKNWAFFFAPGATIRDCRAILGVAEARGTSAGSAGEAGWAGGDRKAGG